ncbi:MAG TPA: MaoC/PaaZ C-terminal domain-containing protein [Actinomycetota bacterium]|nr:MaoC/PaaZ C-terminal domain-containing protein [Actinomycetota bacterium]
MTRRFENVAVGEELPALAKLVTREDVEAYADASGDLNPLHRDDDVARAAGFPGVIAHGMFTMAHMASCVTRWLGDAHDVVRLRAQFRAPVLMGETIVAGGTVRSVDPDTRGAVLDLWVTLEREGRTEYPIRRGEAEVRLA